MAQRICCADLVECHVDRSCWACGHCPNCSATHLGWFVLLYAVNDVGVCDAVRLGQPLC